MITAVHFSRSFFFFPLRENARLPRNGDDDSMYVIRWIVAAATTTTTTTAAAAAAATTTTRRTFFQRGLLRWLARVNRLAPSAALLPVGYSQGLGGGSYSFLLSFRARAFFIPLTFLSALLIPRSVRVSPSTVHGAFIVKER